jgi:hypothetical protein
VSKKVKDFDEMMQGNPVWTSLGQYAHVTSIIIDYINTQITNFNSELIRQCFSHTTNYFKPDGEASLLDISSLLPNQEALSATLNQFLTPEVTAAIMRASINANTVPSRPRDGQAIYDIVTIRLRESKIWKTWCKSSATERSFRLFLNWMTLPQSTPCNLNSARLCKITQPSSKTSYR